MKKRLFATLLACALGACSEQSHAVPAYAPASGDAAVAAGMQACSQRANDTPAKLDACITQGALWARLSQFQRISDQNPGPNGHGNRDTGTPGYLASVNYVAGVMRAAGYAVTIQRYNWRGVHPDGAPKFQTADRTGEYRRDLNDAAVSGTDYNLIADSKYGDPNRIVVVEWHLDAIFGAGILDNASGSTTILEVALALAKTPTHNRLRFVWFGGEELGLLGSNYYTHHLSAAQRKQIVFDEDVDVTATPNFDILVADPALAYNHKKFPPNVIPQSKVGNEAFARFFARGGVVSQPAVFGNDGTDSNSFSLIGIPNTGVLTNQDCCKKAWERKLWGGFLGNYEGTIPSFNGGCVDRPLRWCDNLSNNDPFVFQLVSKAVAYVTLFLANDASLPRG